MSNVFTAKDAEALVGRGGSWNDVPAGAVVTPSARDVLAAGKRSGHASAQAASSRSGSSRELPTEFAIPDYEFKWQAGKDPQTPDALAAFYFSPEIEAIKRRMCEMGRRMWQKGYTDGNGGNLTVRVGDNLVLCTPTLISKGFMEPEDICLVDMEGRQIAGRRRRTSECMTHLAIMKRQPKAKACCHAHPPHATAFAVAKVQPPTCLIPEAEVFLGQIGMSPYQTPGTPENAKAVGEAAVDNMAVLMENHGVITWGKDIEDAYWKMENTDAYCLTIWVASQLGRELTPISGGQAKELITLRKSLGMDDKRADWKECELCDNSDFRPGFAAQGNAGGDCGCPMPNATPTATATLNQEAEAVVAAITDRILAELSKR